MCSSLTARVFSRGASQGGADEGGGECDGVLEIHLVAVMECWLKGLQV